MVFRGWRRGLVSFFTSAVQKGQTGPNWFLLVSGGTAQDRCGNLPEPENAVLVLQVACSTTPRFEDFF